MWVRLYVWLTLRLLPRRSERGASAVEYAMLVALVGIIALVSYGFFEVVKTVFAHACNQIGDCQ